MNFFMTLECLQGCTEAIEREEWGKGSIVTVFRAWSDETSSRAEVGGRGDLCCEKGKPNSVKSFARDE